MAIGSTGSVVVYNASFERTELRKLARDFPEHALSIEAIISRFFDQREIFLNYYMDADFLGSTSIKVVLPVLVPELSYKALAIQHGDDASANWNKMISSPDQEERQRLERELREYCKLDTRAMLEIHRVLISL